MIEEMQERREGLEQAIDDIEANGKKYMWYVSCAPQLSGQRRLTISVQLDPAQKPIAPRNVSLNTIFIGVLNTPHLGTRISMARDRSPKSCRHAMQMARLSGQNGLSKHQIVPMWMTITVEPLATHPQERDA